MECILLWISALSPFIVAAVGIIIIKNVERAKARIISIAKEEAELIMKLHEILYNYKIEVDRVIENGEKIKAQAIILDPMRDLPHEKCELLLKPKIYRKLKKIDGAVINIDKKFISETIHGKKQIGLRELKKTINSLQKRFRTLVGT